MGHPLEERVDAVRRLADRQVRQHGLARWLTGALVALAVAALADYFFRFQDRGLRALLSLACAGAIGWAAWRFCLPAFRLVRSRVETALELERFFPALRHRLASAIEFLAQPLDDHLAGSAALRRGVVIDAMALGEGLDFQQAVDRRPAQGAWRVLAGVATLLAGVVIADLAINLPRGRGAQSFFALERLAMPWRDLEWPRANHLIVRRPVHKLARGSDFEIEIIDQYQAALPGGAMIHYRAADGTETSEPLRTVAKRLVARKEGVQESFAFRVTGGDEHAFPWTEVEVVDPPQVTKLAVTLHYPEYIGWPPESSTPLIRAWRGTRLELRGVSDAPLRSALVRTEGGGRFPAKLSADRRGFTLAANAETPFLVENSGAYWIELETEEGIPSADDERYEIRALTDTPPRVTFMQPAGNLAVTPDANVPLELAVADDLAIQNLGLRYLRSDQSDRGHQELVLYQGPEQQAAPRDGAVAKGEERRLMQRWELTPLGFAPGAQVTLLGVARDYLPQEGVSAPRSLTIITTEELLERLGARQASLLSELARLLRLQQDARAQIEGVRTAWHHVTAVQSNEVDRLHGGELTQRQVTRGLSDPIDGLPAQVAAILSDLEMNRLDQPDTLAFLRDVQQVLAALNAEPLPKLEREFTAAVKQAQQALDEASEGEASPLPETLPGTVMRIGAEQDRVIAELEALLNRLTRWDALRRQLRDLAQLIQDQNTVATQTVEIGRRTLARSLRDLAPTERAELERLAGMQRELARRFDNLTLGLIQAATDLAASDAVAAQTIHDALSGAQSADAAGSLRGAGQSVEENQIGQAAERQARALAALQAMLDALSNRQEKELAKLVEQLRAAEAALAEMQARQAGLGQQAQGIAQSGENEESKRAALASLANQQRDLAEEAARLTNNLQRMHAEAAAEPLADAATEMQSAAAQAQQGAAQGSAQAARQAQQALAAAQQHLAELRQAAEQRAAEQAIEKLGQALVAMETTQTELLAATERLETRRLDAGQWSRAELGELRNLAQTQATLEGEAKTAAENLGAAKVLRRTLEMSAESMRSAAELLSEQNAGDRTQDAERRALARLAQLREALTPPPPGENEAPPPEENSGSPEENGQNPSPETQADAARRLAELKMLKLLQAEVYDTTRVLEDARRRAGDLSPEEKSRLDEISAEQGRLAEMLLELTRESDAKAPEDE